MLVIPTVTTQWRQCTVCVQGWRWSFYISGIPGVVLGLLILLTVREPPRRTLPTSLQSAGGGQTQDSRQMTACQKLACTLKPFMTFSVILLCLGGSIRNAGEARTVFIPHLSQSGLKTHSFLMLKPVLNWANVCSPNILQTVQPTMIHFLIELLVRRTWFGQSKLYFVLNWLVMRCKLRPELAADAHQTA